MPPRKVATRAGATSGFVQALARGTRAWRGLETSSGAPGRRQADLGRVFFDSTDQGFCVLELAFDKQGRPADFRFLEVNAVVGTIGFADAPGQLLRELVPEHEEFWFQTYGDVALSGTPIRFESHVKPLGRWYDVFAFRVAEPEEHRVAVLFRDITPRKQMESVLDTQRAQLQQLFEAAPVGIYLVDDDLRMVAVNSAAMPAFADIPDLIGMRMTEVTKRIWMPEFAEEFCDRLRHTLETGEPYLEPERSELRRDSDVREYYEWHVSRITMPGNRHGVVCYFRDISRDVRARKALAESHRKKDEFIATLSHELRNPLFAIHNGVEMLWRVCGTSSEASATIGMLERQVEQIKQLMDDLLDISRLSRGKVVLQRKPISLVNIVEGVIESVEHVAVEMGHDLTVVMPPEPLVLFVDPTRISQVLGNVLSNAFKFTHAGGKIKLSVTREGDEAVIQVSDTGIGIPASAMPKIFDMFAQLDNSLERMQSGLGIGLTLVRNLVELHGGTVEARSPGPGQGSDFIIRLPIVEGQEPVGEGPPPPSLPIEVEPMRILVVDDNRDAANTMSQLLRLEGHEVHTAYDGLEAVELAPRLKPDVIFMDIAMPRLSGYDAARRLRRDPLTRDLALIAVTGYGQEHDRRKAWAAGFDEHLIKPATRDAIARVLAVIPRLPP